MEAHMNGYCTMLSIGNYGRFANALFQVAGVLGVARRNGLQPVFPKLINHDHRDRFGSKEEVDVFKFFEHELPGLPAVHWQDRPVQWGYEDVRLTLGNWNISGHFQSFRYFEHCADEVRYYLTMKDEMQTDACALHYRAGDYEKGPNVYHPRMPLYYYEQACKEFPADQQYMVFSDDQDEVQKICKELRIKYTLSPGKDYIEDFRLMKGCNNFIIANSSYSAMAAWLSDKGKVISPSGYNWFGTRAGITGDAIIDPDWHQIRFDKTKIFA